MWPSPDVTSPPPELIHNPITAMPPAPRKPKSTFRRRRRTTSETELIDVSYKQLELFFQISPSNSPMPPELEKSQLGFKGFEEEECRTPTSNESKLSAAMAAKCPPTPAKLRPDMRRKRGLLKEEYFVEVGMEELQNLFRPRGSPAAGEPAAGREYTVRKKRRVMC